MIHKIRRLICDWFGHVWRWDMDEVLINDYCFVTLTCSRCGEITASSDGEFISRLISPIV